MSDKPMPKALKGGPGPMPGGSIEKAKDFKTAMRNLFAYLKPYKFRCIMIVILAIASTGFSIVGPKILGNMTNIVFNDYVSMQIYDTVTNDLPEGTQLPAGTTGADIIQYIPESDLQGYAADQIAQFEKLDLSTRPQIDYAALLRYAYLLLILYAFSGVFMYMQGWIVTTLTQKTTYKMRQQISQKINKMPLSYFDRRSYGDVLSHVTNDIDTVGQTLNQSMTQLITAVAMIVGIFIMMLSINWQLTMVTLILVPFSFLCIAIIVKKSQKHFVRQQELLGKINGHVEEMYGGHIVMKSFNGEEKSIKAFKNINNNLYKSAWKSQFLSGLMMPLMNLFSNLGFVGVSVVGCWLVVKGAINVGDVQAFIQYVRQFNQPILQVASTTNVLQSTAAAAERVFEFLSEEEEIPEAEHPAEIPFKDQKIDFNDIVFGYLPGITVIKDFSANVKPGQRIAIVGPTGAGKTTMVNLLMRFYDVNSGSIKIADEDIRNLRRADLRRRFGMVLQDTWLFNGTIRQNLTYGKPDATEKEIQEVVKAARIEHLIKTLPHGLDSEINEEASNISQGEKQLLTIARAMIANPPTLILDEATSSVDTRTELLIQQAMDKIMENRTSFVIAHRLSTIKNADLILVMRDGNIVEKGNHKQLLAQNGFYASLYNSQFAL